MATSEIADDYRMGARPTGTIRRPSESRRSDYRTVRPTALTLQLGEKLPDLRKDKGRTGGLGFSISEWHQAEPAAMGKVVQGIAPPELKRRMPRGWMLSRAMILVAPMLPGPARIRRRLRRCSRAAK